MRLKQTKELETLTSDGSATITDLLMQFKTSNAMHAGTDANVSLQVDSERFACPDRPGNDNERGEAYTFALQLKPRMSLHDFRNANIWLLHDNSGEGPGWKVDDVLLQVVLGSTGWLDYKRWNDVGWLASDVGTVIQLQGASPVAPYDTCSHGFSEPDPACPYCRTRWPDHPGANCKCPACRQL
jgi:hypothetical protein